MNAEQELPLDPAYTDGPYSVIPMPINANGTGPEMDPAKVKITLYEVWNGHCLSLGQWPSRALAQFVADALNRRSSDEQAEVVGWQPGERELAHRWATRLCTTLSTKPDHADDCLWLERLSRLFASPPAVAARGVTEARAIVVEMVARNERNGFLTDWWCKKLDALTAALAVRDEGIREGDNGKR